MPAANQTSHPSQAGTSRSEWTKAQRIVVKIGSSLLADHTTGAVRAEWLGSLADDIAALKSAGKQVIIVSSGAIALGRHVLGLPADTLKLEESQAAAAAGQIGLAHAYQEHFGPRNLTVAQVLLTLSDTEVRRRYLNARNTITTLLKLDAVPIINENDTVATSEIRYGDNDRLSARVASMISADCLVLLSDVDGLYTAAPESGRDAKRLDEVLRITPEIEAMAGDAGTGLSRGGMVTKLEAAKIANAAGTSMVIASGKVQNPLHAIGLGAPCTWFPAPSDPVTARKRWIAGQLEPSGALVIDGGAEAALISGKSLLPAGVTAIEGKFDRGDCLLLRATDGREIGRGLVAYAHADARRIMGRRSNEMEEALGFKGRTALIHRDDLVLNRTT